LTILKDFKVLIPKFLSPSEKKKLKKFMECFLDLCRNNFPEDENYIKEIKEFYLS
jgi:hypothetical protein